MDSENTRKKAVAIKKALLDRGVRQTEIARALGVSSNAVCLFISGKSTSRRFSDYMKNVLGIDVDELVEHRRAD